MAQVVLEGDEIIRVVGTSHRQEALLALAPRRAQEEVRVEKVALLVAEPDNPHDAGAIAVVVDDVQVGYLARDENGRWRDVVAAGPVACEAMIAGREGTTGLGVFLRLPTPTEARAQLGIRAHQRG